MQSALSPEVKKWKARLDDARRKEKNFRQKGDKLVELYEMGDDSKIIPYNILYSNTETMAPAIYNSTPRPLVKRRFLDDDPLAAAAGMLGKRVLTFLMDTNDPRHQTFEKVMEQAVHEGLVPARGLGRIRYYAATDYAKETACFESVGWNKVLFGPAKAWEKVPWLAIIHVMSKEQIEKDFKTKIDDWDFCGLAELDKNDEKEASFAGAVAEEADEKFAIVYEIWDKSTKDVVWLSCQYPKVIKKDADPYQLQGFFPMPAPLTFTTRISHKPPIALYTFYEAQAEELNEVSRRIKNVVRCMRVRGIYDSTLGEDIQNLLKEEHDGDLVAAENIATYQQGYTIDKAIWFMPIEKLGAVFQQLLQEREAIKQVIYEITGIADIMRGSSAASETLGAQQIKTQWGTLRLKRAQKAAATYARDMLRLMLEMAITTFDEATLKGISGLPFPLQAEKEAAMAQVQELQMLGQEAPLELQKTAALPSIQDLVTLLSDDMQRNWRIDIETNSTIDAEATENKQEISELFSALSQLLAGIGPMVQDGTMPKPVASGLMLAVARRFNFGDEVEEMLKQMGQQPPQPKEDPAKLEKAKKDLEMQQEQLKQEQAALKQASMELEYQKRTLELERKYAEKMLQLEAKGAVTQIETAEAESGIRMQEGVAKAEQLLTSRITDVSNATQGLKQRESEIGKKEQAVKQGETENNELVLNAQKEMQEAFAAVMQALATMTAAQKAPRQITDGKGRTLTISPAMLEGNENGSAT